MSIDAIIKENSRFHASKMDISNIMCLLALLLCCTYLSLIQNQIGAAVLFKILAFQARRHMILLISILLGLSKKTINGS